MFELVRMTRRNLGVETSALTLSAGSPKERERKRISQNFLRVIRTNSNMFHNLLVANNQIRLSSLRKFLIDS